MKNNNNSKSWSLEELVGSIENVLNNKIDSNDVKLVEGRAQYVVLSPGKEHKHFSEEIAVCVNGSGQVDIEGDIHVMSKDSIVYVPSDLNHVTTSGEDGLTVLWFYAPTGSESKWLTAD